MLQQDNLGVTMVGMMLVLARMIEMRVSVFVWVTLVSSVAMPLLVFVWMVLGSSRLKVVRVLLLAIWDEYLELKTSCQKVIWMTL